MLRRFILPARALCLSVACAGILAGCGAPTATPAPTAGAPQASAAPAATAGSAASADLLTEPTAVPGEPKALRQDITIRKVLETGGNFVRMKLDSASKAIYYMDAKTNIYRLDPQSGTIGAPAYTAADVGVDDSFVAAGMAFAPDGTLYVLGNVADETTTHPVIRRGKADAAGKRTWTTLASTVPYAKSNTNFDHLCNGIVVSPDGRYLYVNSGSRSDHGEVEAAKGAFPDMREIPLTSAIFRIPTDTDDQVLPNDEAELKAKGYMFADGTRNAYDLAFAPNGDLFAGDNGPDADYPDEFNWLREGHHYGFPWRFGNSDNPQRAADYDPSKDKRLQPEFTAVKNKLYANDPAFLPAPDGVTFTDPVANVGPSANVFRAADGSDQQADAQNPAYSFTPHRSPLGLVFDGANAVGGGMTGDGFILSWGAAEGNIPDPGRDLLALKLTKSGDAYQATMTQLAVGFDHPIDGALLGHTLYVLDWGGKGTIWEITLPAQS